MPKQIPLAEIRQWLRQYEQGKSIATIAKRAKHDVRTVDRGIQQARHELDARAARSEMLKDALRQHQDDLAEVIESLRSAVVVLPPETVRLPFDQPDSRSMPLGQATATSSDGKQWTITLAMEDTTQWELLQEHTRRDYIWKFIAQWKSAVAEHFEARLALGREVATVLCEATGLKVMKSIDTAGDNYLYATGIEVIYTFVVDSALGLGAPNLEKELRVEDSHLYYGRDRLPVLTVSGPASEYKTKIIGACHRLLEPAFVDPLVPSYQLAQETTQKANRAIEELSLMRMVPGQCRVCRRLGL